RCANQVHHVCFKELESARRHSNHHSESSSSSWHAAAVGQRATPLTLPHHLLADSRSTRERRRMRGKKKRPPAFPSFCLLTCRWARTKYILEMISTMHLLRWRA
ncbi:unnamed protein product, partial [Pleuronectes platessa]